MRLNLLWQAKLRNGRVINQDQRSSLTDGEPATSGCLFTPEIRPLISEFRLLDQATKRPFLTVDLGPQKRLIYRRRPTNSITMHVGGGTVEIEKAKYEPVSWIVGWQETRQVAVTRPGGVVDHHPTNIQMLFLVHDTGEVLVMSEIPDSMKLGRMTKWEKDAGMINDGLYAEPEPAGGKK